jgi:hypothetical protein
VLFVPGWAYGIFNKPNNPNPLVQREVLGLGAYVVDASRMTTPEHYGQYYVDQLWQDLDGKTDPPPSHAQRLLHRYQRERLWQHTSGQIPAPDLAQQNRGNETDAIILANATAAWRTTNYMRKNYPGSKITGEELDGAIDRQFNLLSRGDRQPSYPAHGLQKNLLVQRFDESSRRIRPLGARD